MSEIAVAIEEEMKTSYIDYAMSVIVGRALPDVRDGLKPVHRRILFAMKEMGLEAGKPYKKSARVVGDVIGKYHPHGDQAVYDALVRMAQGFSMRSPLVDGQGNFGSIDGDPPAAMRYTEVRLAKVAGDLLADIDKDTVDFVPNYDESLVEPSVLPSRIPNLLINGAQGIAVGMSTSIPPHNLGEIVDALVTFIQNPDLSDEEFLELVPGPDFPTGGFICGTEGIRELYSSGKGKVVMRGRVITETDHKTGKTTLVITELPYQVNKAQLVEKIVHLVSQKKIEGVSEVRDESDRDGIRVVIELKRECLSAQAVVNRLFKLTPLQSAFHANFLALVGGQPKTLNLRELLRQFVSFRKDVVTRRTRYELKKAEEHAHILEGLKIALDNLDAVIKLIRASKTPEEARRGLIDRFKLTEVQARAILEMRLQRLTALERDKIVEEYKEVIKRIAELKEILASERRLMGVITSELLDVKEKYADERRTEILPEVEELSEEDLIPEETMVVTISGRGFIKRNQLSLFRAQRRGGKGIIGMSPDTEDYVAHLFAASTHDSFLFFTDKGRVYSIPCYQIPQAGRATRGRSIANLLDIERTGESVTAVLPVADFEEGKFVVFLTRRGIIKKTELTAFSNIRRTGIVAINLDEGDELISVAITCGGDEIFIGTKLGKAIRFSESDVRPMGRSARGVKGISLAKDDECVGMEIVKPGMFILTVTERGYGKRSKADDYRFQSRGGQGVLNVKLTSRTGRVVGFKQVEQDDEMLLIADTGKIIRIRVKDSPVRRRVTQGVKLINLDKSERVAAIAKVEEDEEKLEL